MNCYQRGTQYASTDEFCEKVKKFAQDAANNKGFNYLVVQKNNGAYTWIAEKSYKDNLDFKIILCVPPMQRHAVEEVCATIKRKRTTKKAVSK